MFSYVSPEQHVPLDHPLRPVREMVDTILKEMSPRFARLYVKVGRPAMAPERLLMDFHGQRRSNETQESTTGPDCRLYQKSKGSEAKLSYGGHVLLEKRNGLLVKTMVTQADGTAERDAALLLAAKIPGTHRVTLGGDNNYDTRDFVSTAREMQITPHVAQNTTYRRARLTDARRGTRAMPSASRNASEWSNRSAG